jgi:hypothetical protein
VDSLLRSKTSITDIFTGGTVDEQQSTFHTRKFSVSIFASSSMRARNNTSVFTDRSIHDLLIGGRDIKCSSFALCEAVTFKHHFLFELLATTKTSMLLGTRNSMI